jgi:uncharacterized protein
MIAEVRAVTALEAGAARAFLPTRERQPEEQCEPGFGLQPGSEGEHFLQDRLGTTQRAQQFYKNQVVDYLTPIMAEFIQRMEMAFIATSDPDGECDCSFRAGAPGFIRVIDEKTIAYPELRGNGVMASMGNMLQNPHIGLFFVDFSRDLIGLHVNGDASIVPPAHMLEFNIEIDESENVGKKPVQWVLIHVTEAYIHCSKHIPLLVPQSRVRHWGTDNPRHKGGDYFGVTAIKTEAGLIEPRKRPAHAQADGSPPHAGPEAAAPLPVANGSSPLPVANGSSPLPVANGSSPLPVANGSGEFHAVNGSVPLPAANGSVSVAASNGSAPLPAANGAVSSAAADRADSLPHVNGSDTGLRVNESASLATADGSATLVAPRGSALRPQCKSSASRPASCPHANGSSSPQTSSGSASPQH